jgi:hypothetical protein
MVDKITVLPVTYEVREDNRQLGRFLISRSGAWTDGFGKTIHMAVISAIRDARNEATTTHSKTRVVLVVDGHRTEEWKSP